MSEILVGRIIKFNQLYSMLLLWSDIQMASPPQSPPQGLQGASRTTGGVFRGHAHGNVYNFGDPLDIFQGELAPRTGKIHLYTERVDPSITKPILTFKNEVTLTLAPVLRKLERRYSPVSSELFN